MSSSIKIAINPFSGIDRQVRPRRWQDSLGPTITSLPTISDYCKNNHLCHLNVSRSIQIKSQGHYLHLLVLLSFHYLAAHQSLHKRLTTPHPPKPHQALTMPPKAAPAEGATSGPVINGQALTFQETKVVCAILENLTTKVDANWEKVAESLGQKNAKSAREAWRLLRKKCDLNLDGLPDGAAAGAASTSAKKAVPAAAAAVAENGEVGVTPVKRGRGRPPKKAMMLTPGNGGDEDAALSTPGTALGNLDLGDMTPETPSKTGSGIKRSAEDANDPDAILFEETPAKKRATPRKPRMTAKQKAALAAAAAAAPTDESANGTTDAGFVPASSPVGDTIKDGDNSNIGVAIQGVSELEAIADTLAADDAADAAHLVGGIDPDET